MYPKVTLFHISLTFVGVSKGQLQMSLVFVTKRVPMKSEKHVLSPVYVRDPSFS